MMFADKFYIYVASFPYLNTKQLKTMNKDQQRLLQKLYEALDMCKEQDLNHEKSLLSMAAGCIEDEIEEEPTEADITQELIEMEDQDWYDTEEERLKKKK